MTDPVTNGDVAAIAEEIEAEVPQLQYLRLSLGIGGDVKLDMLRVHAGERGSGHASRALDMLTQWADTYGVVLTLTPDPAPLEGERAVGRERLTRWYARHGWRRNTGRYARLEYTAGMYRLPQNTWTCAAVTARSDRNRRDATQ